MVVRHDDRRRVDPDCLTKELANPHHCRVQRPDIDGVNLHDLILGVEDDRLEMLLLQRPHLEHQQIGRVRRRLDREALLRRGNQQSPAEFKGGLQLGCLGLAQPLRHDELAERRAGQPRQSAVGVQQALRKADHVLVFGAYAQDDGKQFGDTERSSAILFQPLARTLVLGEFLDRRVVFDEGGIRRHSRYLLALSARAPKRVSSAL
jgi:hypothetical protein